MPIVAKKNKQERSNAPEGLWPAVCVDAIDMGTQETKFGPKHQVKIRWQLEERDPKTNKRFQVAKKFNLSLHEKSGLSLTLEAWRGKKFTEKEREGFDVEKLIGVCGQVQVIHNIKDDGEVWANVQTCVPYPKNTPMLRAEEYTREIDRDQADGHGYEPQDSDVPF